MPFRDLFRRTSHNPGVLCALVSLAVGQDYGRPPVTQLKTQAVVDIKGVRTSLPTKGTPSVIVFATSDCPIAGRMAPYLAEIVDQNPKLPFYVVMPAGTPSKEIEVWRTRTAMPERVALVRDDDLRKCLKVDVVPTSVVVLPDGKVAYYGRINDLYQSHSVPKPRPQRNDLSLAIQEVLAGKPVSLPYAPAVGCFLG